MLVHQILVWLLFDIRCNISLCINVSIVESLLIAWDDSLLSLVACKAYDDT